MSFIRLSELLDKILGEFSSILHQVDENSTKRLVERVLSSDRIFLAGMGRSGLIARPYAMRLMQLGFQVYMVGDATTPSIGKGDLLIAISGSGETKTTHHIAASAKNSGASVFLLTNQTVSSISRISDLTLVLPASCLPVLPLGSAFEGAVHIFLDAVVILIMEKTGITQEQMMKRHSNLE